MKYSRSKPRPIPVKIASTKFQRRFFNKVQKTDNCWVWQGSLLDNGYGHIKLDGYSYLVHRVSYAIYKELKNERLVRHNCSNKACCNPDHLYIKL